MDLIVREEGPRMGMGMESSGEGRVKLSAEEAKEVPQGRSKTPQILGGEESGYTCCWWPASAGSKVSGLDRGRWGKESGQSSHLT